MNQTELGQKSQGGTLAEALDNLNEQLIENMAKNRGLWEVFKNSQKVEGFETAKKAWLLANRKFIHNHAYKKLRSLEEASFETATELFFQKIRLNAPSALKEFAPLVSLAAQGGNVEFFERIVSELRKAKRNKPMDMLEGTILIHWIGCCLWLASDHAASIYLQQVTKKTVTESGYAKARQRLEKLGLVGYSVAHKDPLITGCTKQATFTYRKGWTNLVPGSSR